ARLRGGGAALCDLRRARRALLQSDAGRPGHDRERCGRAAAVALAVAGQHGLTRGWSRLNRASQHICGFRAEIHSMAENPKDRTGGTYPEPRYDDGGIATLAKAKATRRQFIKGVIASGA